MLTSYPTGGDISIRSHSTSEFAGRLMLKGSVLSLAAMAGGFLLAVLWPGTAELVRSRLTSADRPVVAQPAKVAAPEAPSGPPVIRLSEDQVTKAAIGTARVAGGQLFRHLHVP